MFLSVMILSKYEKKKYFFKRTNAFLFVQSSISVVYYCRFIQFNAGNSRLRGTSTDSWLPE